MNDRYFKREKEYSYEELQKMRKHANEYIFVTDKKWFLKQITPIEQKMVLLSSSRPYDVLVYLDELKTPATMLMLEELRDEEIINLLSLFTSEDKKQFYATFSNSFLVNRFIEHDTKFFNHIPELDLDRKIELMDNSDMSTLDATKRLYESVSDKEKLEVKDSLTTSDGIATLNSLSDVEYSDNSNNYKADEAVVDNEYIEIEQNDNELVEALENKEEIPEEIKEEESLREEFKEENLKEEQNELMNEEKSINNDAINTEKKEVVNNQINNLNNNVSTVEVFQQSKNNSEKIYLDQIKVIVQQNLEKDNNIKTM